MISVRHIVMVIVLVALVLLEMKAQTGQITGRVETTDGQPVGSATLTLRSSLGDTRYHVQSASESDGTFRIPLRWPDINAANSDGATWSVTAEKEGYTTNQVNVILANGRVQPERLVIKLAANPYEQFFPLVDGCPRSPSGAVTMYVFDLKAVKLDPQTAGTIPEWLSEKLDRGIRAHLESYNLLGNLKIRVRICGSFPVKTPEAAVVFGQRLGTPAVLWGDVVGSASEKLTARLKFTSLIDEPITDITSIHYNSIDSLYQPGASVHKAYFAFASFILGKIHLQQKNMPLALKCFHHATELNALPSEMTANLNATLQKINATNIAGALTPIGGGSP
jgi:hypothetical protein